MSDRAAPRDRASVLRLSVLFGTIYFVQGVSEPTAGLISQPVLALLKSWRLDPATISLFMALLALPWTLKPLMGLVTDFVPLLGWRRRSWLVLASATACAGLLATWAVPLPAGAAWPLLALLLLPTVGVAFADVVADALMVERGKPLGATGRLQSVQWAAVNAAGIFTGVAGGWLAARGQQRLGFLVCGLACLATLGAALAFVRERRRPGARARPRQAARLLREAVTSPGLLAVASLLFLWRFNPLSSTVVYLHLTQELGVSEQRYGVIASLVSVSAIGGALAYGAFGRLFSSRALLHAAIAIGALGTLAWWAVRGPTSATVVAVVVGFFTMIAVLVQLDFAARSCASASAGTVFAFLMAASNLGTSGSTWVGGACYDAWREPLGPQRSFELLVVVGALSRGLCWLTLRWFPSDPDGTPVAQDGPGGRRARPARRLPDSPREEVAREAAMRCEELMKRDVVVVRAEDTLERAARIMRERLIGFLPVCGPELHAVGVVTDRDLVVRGLAEGRDGRSPVSDVMSAELVACGPQDDLELAQALMSGRQKSRLLVCDAELHVMGVISLSDLAQHEEATQAAATLRRVTWRDRDTIRSGAVERCADIMKRDVVFLGPEDPVVQAARLMRDHRVGFLPVCREDGKLVGVVTDRDLALRVLADGGAPDRPVRDVMTREVVACGPQDALVRAEELMARHKKSRLPAVDADGRVEGVLSLSDVAKHVDPQTVGTTLRQVSAREAC